MPKLVQEQPKKARCPVCRKAFPVSDLQIGCCIECPYCHANFRLFGSDLVKPKRLVLLHSHSTRPRTRGHFMVLIILLFTVGVFSLLYVVWKKSLELAAAVPEPPWPVEQPAIATGRTADQDFPDLTSLTSPTGRNEQSGITLEQPVSATEPVAVSSSVVLSVRQVGLPGPAVPIMERGEAVSNFPFAVYADCVGVMPYTPSGYMGNYEDMEFDDCCDTKPRSGESCIRIAYKSPYQWVGVAWQDPPNNWGDIPGGYDLSQATRLTFWARGKTGTERAEFKMGLIGRTKRYADSARITTGKIRLGKEWQKYEIPLNGLNLSRVVTAFAVILEGAPSPTIIYIDDICFE